MCTHVVTLPGRRFNFGDVTIRHTWWLRHPCHGFSKILPFSPITCGKGFPIFSPSSVFLPSHLLLYLLYGFLHEFDP